MRTALAAWWTALALAFTAGAALAGDAVAPDPGGERPAMLPPPRNELYPPRKFEWLLKFVSQTDIFHDLFVSFGGEVDFAFPIDDSMMHRPGFYLQLLGGNWGDGEHGHLIPGVGFVHRSSFLMDDIFDGYAMVRAGAVIGLDADGRDAFFGFRVGVGVGLRAGRFVFLELTYEPLWAFDTPFSDGEHTSHIANSLSIGGGVDACFFAGCEVAQPTAEPFNATVELYAEAEHVCTTAEEKKRLCAAVAKAMDAEKYFPPPRDDGIHAFLRGVSSQLDGDMKARVDELLETHERLCHRRDDSKAWSRYAARHETELVRPVSYAPVAVELRRELGCDWLQAVQDVVVTSPPNPLSLTGEGEPRRPSPPLPAGRGGRGVR